VTKRTYKKHKETPTKLSVSLCTTMRCTPPFQTILKFLLPRCSSSYTMHRPSLIQVTTDRYKWYWNDTVELFSVHPTSGQTVLGCDIYKKTQKCLINSRLRSVLCLRIK
jgi:hypothetical protein